MFEINGGRAVSLDPGPYGASLLATLQVCLESFCAMNRYFLLGAIGIVVSGVAVIAVRKDRQAAKRLLILAVNILIVALYLILSCARTRAGYLSRPDVQYCAFFLGMLLLMSCADSVLQWYPIVKTVWPLLLAVAVCNCNTAGRTYGESLACNDSPEACMRVSDDIMQQFLDAEAEGKSQIVLEVPVFQSSDNWPIANYAGSRFSAHFYKFGVTEKYIEVTEIRYTAEKNVELHIAE